VPSDRPRIGISACLLGQAVRFDAGHKRDSFLVETFGRHVEWVPVCPEVEAGFGTPREPMRLVSKTPRSRTGALSLIVIKTGENVTSRLTDYAARRVETLAGERLSGYVLKKDSPSCGMARVKVFGPSGPAERTGRGLFAAALLARCPTLPVEEEGRLMDPAIRENFVERVFAYRRLRALFERRWSLGDLVEFHTAHKLTLLAHSPSAYRDLGRLVAAAKPRSKRALSEEYERRFMTALARIATPGRHANVLQHMVGYFKQTLSTDERAELLGVVDDHRRGVVPLIVPITLVRHHVRRLNVTYLHGQTYLEPHPRELALRNQV
jgi:uncharacterized protein YbgA (DUF1722 family)/uncharacterized protein YbbK (DUF523 family)